MNPWQRHHPADTAAAPAGDAASAPAADAAKPGPVSKAPFGKVDGKDVTLYTLTNANGLVMKVTNYGAIVTELHVPDKAGKIGGRRARLRQRRRLPEGAARTSAPPSAASRNRIRTRPFELDGKKYKLAANDAPHHLHGGKKGWDKVIWDAEASGDADGPSLKLTYVSKDGEEGYPGTVTAHAIYTLTNDNELKVEMTATTDKTTLVNMAHHSYWNLGGTRRPHHGPRAHAVRRQVHARRSRGPDRHGRSRSRARRSTSRTPSRSART